jgi:hypothetical protein
VTRMTILTDADSGYRPLAGFEIWSGNQVDDVRWNRYADDLRGLGQADAPIVARALASRLMLSATIRSAHIAALSDKEGATETTSPILARKISPAAPSSSSTARSARANRVTGSSMRRASCTTFLNSLLRRTLAPPRHPEARETSRA